MASVRLSAVMAAREAHSAPGAREVCKGDHRGRPAGDGGEFFETRTDLVTVALAEHVAACRADMRAALDEPDAWRALSGTIRRFAERQVRDRGLNQALFGSHAAAAAFAEDRRAHVKGLEQLVDRARSIGAVRAEVSVEDVRVGLTAIASFRALRPERAASAMHRLVSLLLAGLAA